MSDLCRRSYIGVCREGVCVRDVASQLYWRLQRRCLCEGCGPAVILAFAEEVPV